MRAWKGFEIPHNSTPSTTTPTNRRTVDAVHLARIASGALQEDKGVRECISPTRLKFTRDKFPHGSRAFGTGYIYVIARDRVSG